MRESFVLVTEGKSFFLFIKSYQGALKKYVRIICPWTLSVSQSSQFSLNFTLQKNCSWNK